MNSDSTDSGAESSSESVGKIREILFGEQMAVYEERFNDLESRLVDQVGDLKKELEASLAELHELMATQKTDLSSAGVHRKSLGDAFQKLAEELRKEPS